MATVDEDLNQLEKDIRQLKIEYDMYFGGGRQRPPQDTQWRAEQMIKRYSERGADMNFSQRFRFNNLSQNFAKNMEVWRKKMKQKEEGFVQRHFGAAAKAIEAQREKEQAAAPPAAAPATAAEARRPAGPPSLYEVACSDPDREPEKVQQLYQALLAAKKKAGEKTDALTLDNFQDFVRLKTEQLKKQAGAKQVEYAVTMEDGQVKLKARTK
ncbi:MAG: hypothetical protein HY234_08545 [Acidobacteria bacterium]|nr:hypothetical protein [Acidobacteriota bacterium]MBI3663080.1 hypothetical protein [Acidobacteriota bacterium]